METAFDNKIPGSAGAKYGINPASYGPIKIYPGTLRGYSAFVS